MRLTIGAKLFFIGVSASCLATLYTLIQLL